MALSSEIGAERIRTAERVRSGAESGAFGPMLPTPQTSAGQWRPVREVGGKWLRYAVSTSCATA